VLVVRKIRRANVWFDEQITKKGKGLLRDLVLRVQGRNRQKNAQKM